MLDVASQRFLEELDYLQEAANGAKFEAGYGLFECSEGCDEGLEYLTGESENLEGILVLVAGTELRRWRQRPMQPCATFLCGTTI